MVRRINKNGGVTLPKSVRVTAGLHPGMAVDVRAQGNMICIVPDKVCCHFCGSPEKVRKAAGVNVCLACAQKIAEVLNGQD